jgi:hypothetical protein
MSTLRHTDQIRQHCPRAVTIGMMTTDQIWPNKMYVRSHPLWDEIHDGGLDLKDTQTDESHDPTNKDRVLQLLKMTKRLTTQGQLPTPI